MYTSTSALASLGSLTFVPRACDPPKIADFTLQPSSARYPRTRSLRSRIRRRCTPVSAFLVLNSSNAFIAVLATEPLSVAFTADESTSSPHDLVQEACRSGAGRQRRAPQGGLEQ